MAMQSINPATGEVLASFDEFTNEQVEQALTAADAAFPAWRALSFAQRAEHWLKAASYLRDNKARFGQLISIEMGKPIGQAEAEIEKCAWNCEFYAENAERFLADDHIPSSGEDSYVAFEPLGVILAIMPWNFPFWQLFRFAAPALMAGNTAVMKHSSNVPQCAMAIEEVFNAAGFPKGVFRTLLISASDAERLIADDRIKAITLTGSSAAGSTIAGAAGRALKKSVLELGGSDPYIVLEDADLQAAATVGAMARNQNTGQSCIAAKRFIVVEQVADEFERLFSEAVGKLKVGDPLNPATNVGPMARRDLRDQLEQQVRASIEQGAQVLVGGATQDGAGYFYQPTVLTGISDEMPAWREETFGPVAAVRRVKDAAEAVKVANDTEYGLGASLWTSDLQRGRELASQIEAGSVFINGMVASDPRLPFGGIKKSGFGRELSEFGIREFVNIQTIWVGPASGQQTPTAPSE